MTKITSANTSFGSSQDHERKQPSKAIRRKVRDSFDGDMLAEICVKQDFSQYAKRIDLPPKYGGGGMGWSYMGGGGSNNRFYYYKDNGSKVLGIAHLDSVQSDGECQITSTSAGLLATSGTLDDRLGVYVILDLLPRLDVTVDWLLTTDEEIAASTAQDFRTSKKYNWMFQFDRAGTDVVMYEYETKALCDMVEDAGARVGQGTFSDICQLDHLGCAGMNWGVGYREYHSRRSHAWLDDTFKMVARFVKFYQTNHDVEIPHIPRWSRAATAVQKYNFEDDWIKGDCGHDINVDDEGSFVELDAFTIICTECVHTFDASSLPKELPKGA